MKNMFAEIFEALNNAKVKYLIVGGVAVNLHGYVRYTHDIDILAVINEQNLERLDTAMNEMGYYLRQPVTIKDLSDKKLLESFISEKNLKAFTYIHSDSGKLGMDILTEESLKFLNFEKKKIEMDAMGLTLPVIHLSDLIDMKEKSNRPKDLIDLEYLLKLKDL